ncbi:hypothetical protein AQUCO_05700065v1 [Aquilegia coerulea]|uniref:4a-hydroxytetrahydrobiopterin dehydratase n=1 Tax=Aquilegia coerulea TaxID=218851 RepID=A0A2G5CFK6_AQUCA|nr:hypothetical protein AQUCO_05700065v1 [Aquilegia coerulea]
MAPTAAMLILPHNYILSSQSSSVQINVDGGKWFFGFFKPPQGGGAILAKNVTPPTLPPSSSSSLEDKFEEAVQLSCCSSIRVTDLLQDHVNVLSNRNSFRGFRTYCTEKDLSIKKCVPCDSKDIRAMTEEAAHSLTPKVPEWDLVNDSGILKLNRSWKVKSFTKGLELFQVVGEVAEAEGHHPDLHLVGWNNVKIEIWTHSVSK